MENKRLYTVYTLKMQRWLADRGFQFVKCEPNRKYPKLTVFQYEPTDDFMSAAYTYLSENKGAQLS